MLQSFIEELRKENLCTHFVLPLLKFNKHNFITSNFVNAFLSEDGHIIYVQIIEPNLLPRRLSSYSFCTGFRRSTEGNMFIGFQIPRKWRADIVLFMEGKFSLMSPAAKECIIRYSKLDNKFKTKNHGIVTDGRILALERHQVLRNLWEDFFELPEPFPDDFELLSTPGTQSYISSKGLIPIKRTQL